MTVCDCMQVCHCGPVSTLCSRTGHPDTGPDYVGCIRKDHARWPAACSTAAAGLSCGVQVLL